MSEKCCAVILAAGEGKRMKSNRPKVLSPVLFKPMLQWVLDSTWEAGVGSVCVVAGYLHEVVEDYLGAVNAEAVAAGNLCHVLQPERRGTGHAAMMAREFLERHRGGSVLILNGDAPFVNADVIRQALAHHQKYSNSVTVLTAELDDPFGYGRIVRDRHTHLISAIVEQKDASPAVREICEINSGAYWFQTNDLLEILSEIKNDNAQGEYYLTDAVKLLIAHGKVAGAYTAGDQTAVLGANDCLQLSHLNDVARREVLCRHMEAGVDIPCSDGVILGPDVTVGSDTSILPGTVLIGKTSVGNGCTVGPNVFLSDSAVGDNSALSFVKGENCTIPPGGTAQPFTVVK